MQISAGTSKTWRAYSSTLTPTPFRVRLQTIITYYHHAIIMQQVIAITQPTHALCKRTVRGRG